MSDDELEGATASAYFTEDDEPSAMTGSAFPADDMDAGEDEPVVESAVVEAPAGDDEPAETGQGFPITINLDASGNGSTHVGVFQHDIASVDLDGIPPGCIWAGDHPSAVGVSVIEVRGAPTQSKPVSGIVVTK